MDSKNSRKPQKGAFVIMILVPTYTSALISAGKFSNFCLMTDDTRVLYSSDKVWWLSILPPYSMLPAN